MLVVETIARIRRDRSGGGRRSARRRPDRLSVIGEILDVETVIGIVPTDPEGKLVGALHPLPDQIEALDYRACNLNEEHKK